MTSRRRVLLRVALVLLTLGAVFFGILPQLADLSEVWSEIAAMSALQVGWLGAVAVGSLLVYGREHRARSSRSRSGGWRSAAKRALASQLSVFLVLLFSLRAVGITAADAGWVELLAVFAVTRLASAVPLTPGGIGFVELGLAGALVALGCPNPEVVAGVLVFRASSFFLRSSSGSRRTWCGSGSSVGGTNPDRTRPTVR